VREQIFRRRARGGFERDEHPLDHLVVAPLAQGAQAFDLRLLDGRFDSQQRRRDIFFDLKAIDAHHRRLARLDGALVIIGGLLNFALG
jgi:hypothetical protein